MDKLNGKTMDLVGENIAKLKALFPEAFAEGKINFAALKSILGEAVDKDSERYSFTWHGKQDAIKMALKQSTGTLRPNKAESKDWNTTENLFIEGDNLEVLRVLQNSYRGKIKMCYIDPPYNTGNDFVYEDNFSDNISNYKKKVGEIFKSNPETGGRHHTNWLNMMYPRLRLAKNLLTDDGVIFISIDESEVANLRKICDEIFGEDNLVSQVCRATGTTTGQDAAKFGSSLDYLFVYRKSDAFIPKGLPMAEKDKARFRYDDNDGKGKYALLQLRKTGTNDRKEDRPNMFYSVLAPNGDEVYPVGPGGYLSCWRVERKKYNMLVEDNIIVWLEKEIEDEFEVDLEDEDDDSVLEKKSGVAKDKEIIKSKFVPYVKYYLEGRTKRPSNIWNDIEGNKKGSLQLKELFSKKIFSNPKPLELISRIIQISEKDDQGLFLDFFAGSATTAHAVIQLNSEDGGQRKFIMIQIPELTPEDSEAFKAGYKTITDIGKERIRRAGDKIVQENKDKGGLFSDGANKLDIGFKVFTLDETNITEWDENTKNIKQTLLEYTTSSLKAGRSQEDVLYEVLLKYGIDLTTPIKELSIGGKKAFSLAGNYLLVCLEKDLTLENIKQIADLKPQRVVFYDDGFVDDSVKANAEQTLKKQGITDIRVI